MSNPSNWIEWTITLLGVALALTFIVGMGAMALDTIRNWRKKG